MKSINRSHILITGGTGSFGKAFVKKVLLDKKFEGRLTIFSRDEFKQYEMSLEYPSEKYPQLNFVLGNIQDKEKLNQECRTVDYIVHAAALKHVSISENNVMEYVKTNIIGTDNVLQAARVNNVKKVVGISTDKVVSPNNVYGATKFCAEKILLNDFQRYKMPGVCVVRFGNFMRSRGAILSLLLRNRDKGSIVLKNADMTRFYVDIDEAVEATFFALENGGLGEVFIPKLRAIRLKDLAEEVLPGVNIVFSQEGKGEKIHEDLLFPGEINDTYDMGNFYVIFDSGNFPEENGFCENYDLVKVPDNFSFSSDNQQLILCGLELSQFIEEQIGKMNEKY